MPNDFTDIGFPIHPHQDARPYLERALREGRRVVTPVGTQVSWSPGEGARLWLDLTPSGEVADFAPDLESSAVTKLWLGGRRPAGDGSASGAFEALWGNVDAPFLFDVPDFRAHDTLALPCQSLVRLTGFAQQTLSAHDSDEAYHKTMHGTPHLASEAFIPSGLILPNGSRRVPPRAWAIVYGHVSAVESRVNPATGMSFVWARLSSLDVTVEIVADPELVPELPSVGGVVGGQFWLSGRPLRLGREYSDLA